MQRIGLSATVGKPESLLDWFAGHCSGERNLVHIAAPRSDVDLKLDHAGSTSNAALLLSRLFRGEKRLTFCESRGMVEDIAQQLRSLDIDTYVSHSALSVDARTQAESAFAVGQNCVIVSTSTLELGLDVGDLDRVIQIDAPGTVASFLQRMGRTGRRAGAKRNTLLISTDVEGFLLALGVINLFEKGYVEPVVPPAFPAHLLVQQLLSATLQSRNALSIGDLFGCLSRIPEFKKIIDADGADLLAHLEAEEIISGSRTGLRLGARGERRFTGKGLADLCVSFETSRMMAVFQGTRHLGDIEPRTICDRPEETKIIALAGRAWRVLEWDGSRHRVYVEPSGVSGETRWNGSSRGVARGLAESIREVITDPARVDRFLSKRARVLLAGLVEELSYTLSGAPAYDSKAERWEWWTYAGDSENRILAAYIHGLGGKCTFVDGFHLVIKKLPHELRNVSSWADVTPAHTNGLDLKFTPFKFEDLLPTSLAKLEHLARLREGL